MTADAATAKEVTAETATKADAAAAATKRGSGSRDDVLEIRDNVYMKTAIVILNWNTEGFLREFLPGLVRSAAGVEGAEVVVADNASTDRSMDVMREVFPEVRTIVFDRNYGFTGGYNEAFKILREVGTERDMERPEYFLLINSDIEVTEGWLEPLVGWMDSHPECGACAPKLHSWHEHGKFEYAGAAGGYIDKYGYPFCRGRIMKSLEYDKGQYDEPKNVMWATGACLLVRSSVYEELGGLDNRFFAHMEEIDLCWRMQLHGYKVTVVPESVVYHVGGGTLAAESPFKLRLNYRNNQLMLRNNLAQTFALKMYKDGMPAEKAAAKGCRKAGRRIFTRQCLDMLSALVYLGSSIQIRDEKKMGYYRAVIDAYKELRELAGREKSVQEVTEYLHNYGDKASVAGFYKKWIILESILKPDKIFRSIEERDFYKI